MNSADVEKSRELECKLIDNDFPSSRHEDVTDTRRKMGRNFLLYLLTISVFALVLCSANGVGEQVYQSLRSPKKPTLQDQQRIQDVLNSIEPSSLHKDLHGKIDKYKHRVSQGEKSPVVVVHQKAPEVATSLVELAKRQGPNNGTTTVPPVTSTIETTTQATSTLTTPATSRTVVTQNPGESSSPSSPTSQGSISEVTSGATTLVTSTGVGSSVVDVTSSAPAPTSDSQESSSPPQSASRTPSTSVTSFNIFTTTLPNGKPTTITQTTVVPAGQADQTQAGVSASKTSPGASLQTNGGNAVKLSANMLVGMVGVLYFGAL